MICEPNFNLPQLIDLGSNHKIQQNIQNFEDKSPSSTSRKPKVSYEQKDYKLLPLFKDQFEQLNDVLSLHSNEYLACRWNSFLDSVPESYIIIRSYLDYKKSLEQPVVRRKLLNGSFYGVDNKLSPVPQLRHSRSLKKETGISN